MTIEFPILGRDRRRQLDRNEPLHWHARPRGPIDSDRLLS
jgi:hypothetical protein